MSGSWSIPDLCVPRPGSTTMRTLLGAALRRALSDLRAILRDHAGGPHRRDVAAFVEAVGPVARSRPGALAAAVRRTEVGGWIRCLRADPTPRVDPAEGLPALLAGLGLELCRLGALDAPLRLTACPRRLSSSAGRLSLELPEDARGVVFGRGAVVVERRGGRGAERSLVPSDAAHVGLEGSDVRLSRVDTNPLAAHEAHPDKDGNALDLGGQTVRRWCEALERALQTVGRYQPELRREIELVLQRVVPVGWDPERHLSASYREAIGTIYLSLHPSPMTMVEALVHEVSHNKLAVLFELDPVLRNALDAEHPSPLRPDPRPLSGVLLAVHAFLPVAALYAAMIEAGAPGSEGPEVRRRLAEIVAGNREGAQVLLDHAQPTAVGRQVLDEIEALALRERGA